ncbi:MAG: hypothetical protein ACJ72M_22650 [Propionibacteriaceae bacterium]|jgi:hypothetical protein
MATAEELGTELDAVCDEIENLKRRRDDLIDRMAAVMTEDLFRIEALGKTFKRRRKADRKHWQTDELRSEVWKRTQRRVDLETGELESEAEAQVRTLTECARLEWRLNPLRELGIDPDEFCEVTRGGWTIQILEDVL